MLTAASRWASHLAKVVTLLLQGRLLRLRLLMQLGDRCGRS